MSSVAPTGFKAEDWLRRLKDARNAAVTVASLPGVTASMLLSSAQAFGDTLVSVFNTT